MARSISSGVAPSTVNSCKSSFIQINAGTTKIKSAIPKVFSTLLKNFQPPFSSPATLYPVKIGMKIIERNPVLTT